MHFSDIQDAAGLIVTYTGHLSWEQFVADKLVQLATERLLQIITEAAARLGDSAPQLCPGPDWANIRQFGNVLRHVYHGLRPETVWSIVQSDVPELQSAIGRARNVPRSRLAILLSGRGSNFLAMEHAIRTGRLAGAEIAVVLSDKADAPGLDAARELGLLAFAVPQQGKGPEARAAQEAEVLRLLHSHGVELVCLAGYMRIISPRFVAAYPGRILNMHPSLLPGFPGLHAQRQALEYGVRVAGCTVHFVDEQVDHGVIVLQRAVPVEDDDTEDTLAERILREEHEAYPEAIARVLSGAFHVVGRRYVRRGQAASGNVSSE